MRNFIFVVVIVAGVWYWQKGGSKNEAFFDQDGNPAVVIFTVSSCAPCKDAMKILKERGVPFEEKEMDTDNEEDEDVKLWRKISNNMLPLTLSGDSKVAGSSKWELISLLGDNFGDQYLLRDEQGYFQQHFDAQGAAQIVLYGASWCPTCATLRKAFEDHDVNYVYIDVEKSGEFEKLTRVMEIPGYPAVWVGYTRVHGTTFDAVKSVVNKKT
jgi:glutaredoxin